MLPPINRIDLIKPFTQVIFVLQVMWLNLCGHSYTRFPGDQLFVFNCNMFVWNELWLTRIMEHVRPPSSVKFEDNVADNWRHWKQQFTVYMRAAEVSQKPFSSTVQVQKHLRCITLSFLKVRRTGTVDAVLGKYTSYNVSLERTLFSNALGSGRKNQLEEKPVDKWITSILIWKQGQVLVSLEVNVITW